MHNWRNSLGSLQFSDNNDENKLPVEIICLQNFSKASNKIFLLEIFRILFVLNIKNKYKIHKNLRIKNGLFTYLKLNDQIKK